MLAAKHARSDRIEFEVEHAIGCHHPNRSRYNVALKVAGYRAYPNNMTDIELLNAFNSSN